MRFFIFGIFALNFCFPITTWADLCSYERQIPSFAELEEGDFNAFLFSGQSVDHILISKSKRRLFLLKKNQVVKSYPTAFGNPEGAKRFEGDMKTPEGLYYIESKNPKSKFYLSLKINYPNAADIAYARKFGKSPGGDIMIHGLPVNPDVREFVRQIHPMDWTRGCVAVTDSEIEEVYHLVASKTPVTICPVE